MEINLILTTFVVEFGLGYCSALFMEFIIRCHQCFVYGAVLDRLFRLLRSLRKSLLNCVTVLSLVENATIIYFFLPLSHTTDDYLLGGNYDHSF